MEEELVGTAGSVKMAERFFDGSFIVHYGDVLTDFDLNKMMDFHLRHNGIATPALLRTESPWESGMVQLGDSGRVLGFREKPPAGSVSGGYLNGGTYILKREILDYIPQRGFYDFGQDLFPRLLSMNIPIYGYILNKGEYLMDIGTLARYQQADEDVTNGLVNLAFMKIPPGRIAPGPVYGDGVLV
jgi:NDP-sugar pyrophosphorylase family protein